MKIISNVHTHSTWCDGKDTTEEMAKAALACGFTDLGYSSHSITPFDLSYSMADEEGYLREIANLKEKYKDQLTILCGTEQDYYAPVKDPSLFDYRICSVHYLPQKDGTYPSVDESLEKVEATKRDFYQDDGLAMARDFYESSAKNVEMYHPTVVGHFDLVAKFNKDSRLFDEESKAYQSLALEALDAAIIAAKEYGGIFELNLAPLIRGFRDVPYPAPFLLRHLAQKGARIIVTSDCHDANLLNKKMDIAPDLLREAGFSSMVMLSEGKFRDFFL